MGLELKSKKSGLKQNWKLSRGDQNILRINTNIKGENKKAKNGALEIPEVV